ncbi:MAG: 50S ribosomal protein L3 [Helicobacteraceae bacterium]|jgi:large subunit ribosomal protein L3|nr:50S ribosomal protein L3 [Helicobacteraceae bacterium]
MEYIVEKIGMTRTLGIKASAVTLIKVLDAKILEAGEKSAIASFPRGKKTNKATAGNQKKYSLPKEFNRFATLEIAGAATGDQDLSPLKEGVILQTSFLTKGRGFAGLIKRWNFQGGPGAHGSRFHRTSGSIGNRDEPGRVHKGRKMAGHYGCDKVSIKSEIVSFDAENKIIAVKGSVPGANGAIGRVKVIK